MAIKQVGDQTAMKFVGCCGIEEEFGFQRKAAKNAK
jgi:hypothetical protein